MKSLVEQYNALVSKGEPVDIYSTIAKNTYGLDCSIEDVQKLHKDKRELVKMAIYRDSYSRFSNLYK